MVIKKKNKLWIHCKDTTAVIELFNFNKKEKFLFNFFHDKDKLASHQKITYGFIQKSTYKK